MTLKSSGLLRGLMIPLVLLAVWVGIKLFSSSKQRTDSPPANVTLTPAEMKALGIEGDTPRDTLATLVAQLKALRQELQTAVTDNKQHKAENERLRQRETAVEQRIQSALDTERERFKQERAQATNEQQETQHVLQELRRRLDGLKGSARDQTELPVGLGLEDGDAEALGGSRLQWTEPQDAATQKSKSVSPRSSRSRDDTEASTGFGLATDEMERKSETLSGSSEETASKSAEPSSLKPVYTMPSDATLIGSVAMTALIGRIPIDGTVNDPYPFKVLIGPDNLTANGIELPEVAGAVASGTASGDWTLSCVRGQIRSLTFVFQDGTIRTVSSSGNHEGSTQEGLGWISDPHGIPCVSGARRSNAEQYLTSQLLITAAGAGAASLIRSNNSNVSYFNGSNGNVLGTVGISGNEALGRILGGGVQELSQWVNKLYGQAFAAIYVQPGAPVAVHIEQPLSIDFDSRGRRVNHRSGEPHAVDLD